MIEIESKTRRQDEGIEKWRLNKGIGTLNYVPRFGKTKVATKISSKLIDKSKEKPLILAISPNDITDKNLKKNLDKSVICVTRNTLILNFSEYRDKEFTLIIIDEIHRFLDVRAKPILGLKSKFKLGLTGDNLSIANKLVLSAAGFPVIDTITEEEAINNRWISPSVEYNLGVDIEEYKISDYVAYSERIKEIKGNYEGLHKRMNTIFNAKVFNSDMDLMYALYSGINYIPPNAFKPIKIPAEVVRGELSETMGWTKDIDLSVDLNVRLNNYFNPSVLQETGKMFNDIVRERNSLIINSKHKIEAVLKIIGKNSVPTIIFNESSNMANLIATAIGDEAIEYHSNVESRYIKNPETGDYVRHGNGNPIKFGAARLKKFAIEGIKQGLFKYLCTVKALNEGVDIPILSQVITTGGTINPSTHMQRIARGKTLFEDNPNKVTTIINIYIKDFEYNGELYPSRDAAKLKIRQKENAAIWVDNIDEIFVDIE